MHNSKAKFLVKPKHRPGRGVGLRLESIVGKFTTMVFALSFSYLLGVREPKSPNYIILSIRMTNIIFIHRNAR